MVDELSVATLDDYETSRVGYKKFIERNLAHGQRT
jgi:hypothetical protein